MRQGRDLFAPKRRAKPHQGEHGLQKTLAQVLALTAMPGVFWSSIDHASRDMRLHQTRKERGVKAGLPDVWLIIEGRSFGLELKAAKGRQSDEQKAIERAWNEAGGEYALAKGIDEALTILRRWKAIRELAPAVSALRRAA